MNQRAKEGLRLALLVSLVAMVLAGCGKNVNRVVPTPPTVPSQPLRDAAVIGPATDIQSIHIEETWNTLDNFGSAEYDLAREADNLVGQAKFNVTGSYTNQQQSRQEDIKVSISDLNKFLQAVAASPVVPFGAIARPTTSEGGFSRTIYFDMKENSLYLDATTIPWIAHVNHHDIGFLNSDAPFDAYYQMRSVLKFDVLYQMRDFVSRPITPIPTASPTPR
jgi:hypothetical protein